MEIKQLFLNIITPCSRPQNLHTIAASINIPRENYRWIVVADLDEIDQSLVPENCEIYLYRNPHSTVGHAQRNFALDLITSGHVYMNDDDTVIHPELWENICNLHSDFISFKQNNVNRTLRLEGNVIKPGGIDSHNFIVSRSAIGDMRWDISNYDADGYFAMAVYLKIYSQNPNLITYIPKALSIYNSLR
jgi:hypothetical protein